MLRIPLLCLVFFVLEATDDAIVILGDDLVVHLQLPVFLLPRRQAGLLVLERFNLGHAHGDLHAHAWRVGRTAGGPKNRHRFTGRNGHLLENLTGSGQRLRF